jgi:hypothetical protein
VLKSGIIKSPLGDLGAKKTKVEERSDEIPLWREQNIKVIKNTARHKTAGH